MAFPVSLPDDGLIDVMAMPLVIKDTLFCYFVLLIHLSYIYQSSRKDVLANIPGAAKGENYWYPKVNIYHSQVFPCYQPDSPPSFTTSKPTPIE